MTKMHRWVSSTTRWSFLRSQSTSSQTAPIRPPTQQQHHHQQEPSSSTSTAPPLDPYALLAPELTHLRHNLLHLLGSSHPTLTHTAKYYFLQPSKQLRPLLVLLFARATNGLGTDWRTKRWHAECEHAGGRAEELDRPLSRADVLNDWNPAMPDHTASFSAAFQLRAPPPVSTLECPILAPVGEAHVPPAVVGEILPTQTRLAQIVEMIHVASLLHDDVLDDSPLRRGAPSAHVKYGSKVSVLAGDFLLGRASAALSRLGESEVVELMATVIANLVEGEILQLAHEDGHAHGELGGAAGMGRVRQEEWNMYLRKSYLKTASLMAKGARAAVVLGGVKEGEMWKEVAYAYGRNIGIAFQVC